jgi:TrpR-related protein YerC/YecD
MSVMTQVKTNELIAALLALKSPAEAQRFMRDLLTEAEIIEFGNRFCAAQMLSDKLPYSLIEKETGLSSTTVARVSKWLNMGGDGYKTIIARLGHHHTYSPAGKGLSS